MTEYSHRDHRVFRAAYRLLGAVTATTIGLVVLAVLAPWTAVGALALLALGVVGAVALNESGRIVDGYVGDLHRVQRGEPVPPVLRVEVMSRIELERSVFVGGRPSPNVRRPRADPGPVPRLGGST